MLRSAHQRLAPYPDDTLGINLGKLHSEVDRYVDTLDSYTTHPFEYYDLSIEVCDPELIEEVELAAATIKPNIPQRRGPQRGAKHEAALRLKNQHMNLDIE
ncbi:hypothetical protein D3C77_516220 [compost metagenome]